MKMADCRDKDSLHGPNLWPEDTVEYRIYTSKAGNRSQLEKLALECNHYAREKCAGHVWHYAPFYIRMPQAASVETTVCPCLIGRTCHRDNIQDEWLIVYILLSLSQQYEDLVISVVDGDGQFLLIEAAHELDKWMDPEEMVNRVFLHRGCVHIIPKPTSPADIGVLPVATPTIPVAVDLVRSECVQTVASDRIQHCLKKKYSSFIDRPLQSHLHHAHCSLPSLANYVLSRDSQLVSAVCHALLDRTPSDMAACRAMSHFSPLKCDMVKGGIHFTRFLYAQMINLRFSPPRKVGFNLGSRSGTELLEYNLGVKLTCGLEMLLCRVGGLKSGGHGSGGQESVSENSVQWNSFMDKLKEWDYFQGHMEGSKVYTERLESARQYFQMQRATNGPSGGEEKERGVDDVRDPLLAAGLKIAEIIGEGKFSEDEEKERTKNISPADDDSWLLMSEGELEDCLHERMGRPAPSGTDSLLTDSSKAQDPGDGYTSLQSSMFGIKSFVDKESAHSGAEFPWEDTSCVSPVQFDPESFLSAVKSMIDNCSESDSDGSLSISEGEEEDDDEGGAQEEGEGAQEEDIKEVMARMEEELSVTQVGRSFETMNEDDEEIEETNVKPVDVDFNLVKNILESYSSQIDGAGPATNILHSMGLHLPGKGHEQTS